MKTLTIIVAIGCFMFSEYFYISEILDGKSPDYLYLVIMILAGLVMVTYVTEKRVR